MGGSRAILSGLMPLLLALLIAGCGSGSDPTVEAKGKGETVDRSTFPPGPTREFIIPGGDNAVQEFGREATPAERRQASAVIHAWMRARAAQDWQKDCSYFSRRYTKLLVDDANGVTDGKVKTCPQALAYFGHEASGDYVNTLTGPIDSLRAGKRHGYAQYHGRGGKDWIVPMDVEGGKWLVANATPIPRNG